MGRALVLSALAHALLIGLIAFQAMIPVPDEPDPVVQIELVDFLPPVPAIPVVPDGPLPLIPDLPPPPTRNETGDEPQNIETPDPTPVPDTMAPPDQSPANEEAPLPSAALLRQQTFDSVRVHPAGPDNPAESAPRRIGRDVTATMPYASHAPRLPSQAGHLNRWVGRVTPSARFEREGTGTMRGRVVTERGQIWCSYTMLPGSFDHFTPAITTWFPCGRERPDAPDPDNPWIRPFELLGE